VDEKDTFKVSRRRKSSLKRLTTGRWIEENENKSGFRSINVSHSKDFILYGAANDWHIGVDVQHFDLRRFSLSMVEAVFTPLERKQCGQHKNRMGILWSLKEACLKALGFGMGFDPCQIEICNASWVSESQRIFPSTKRQDDHLDMDEFLLYIKGEKRTNWVLFVEEIWPEGQEYSNECSDYYCMAVALAPHSEKHIHPELEKYAREEKKQASPHNVAQLRIACTPKRLSNNDLHTMFQTHLDGRGLAT